MAKESKQFNPALAKQISESYNKNYGHVFGDLFTQLGQQAEKREATDFKKETDEINLQTLKDQLADSKLAKEYISSEYGDLNTYLKDNNKSFNTPEYQLKMEQLSDKKMQKIWDESLAGHETYLQEKGVLLDEDGKVDINQVRKQLSNDPNNLELADAFERKYGQKLTSVAEKKEYNTKDIQNYEYGKENPEFEKEQKVSKTVETYSPTTMMKEYAAEMKSKYGSDKSTWEPIHEYAESYRQSKKLSGEATYNNIINRTIEDYSEKLNTDDFANIDFNKAIEDKLITPNEKRKIERKLASTREAKTLESQYGKYKPEFETITGQAQRFAKYAKSKKVNTNVVQNAKDVVKSYVPNLEVSEKELENFEFRSDFLNLSSTILKLQSGLAVSDKEREQFNRSMGTLNKNKDVNFIGIKQKILDKRNAMAGIKNTAPEYFNIKYGKTLRNLDNSLNIIDEYLSDKSKTNTEENTEVKINAVTYDPAEKETNPVETKTKESWRDYE